MRASNLFALALAMSLTAATVFAAGQERPGADQRHCHKYLQTNAEKLRANFSSLDADHDSLLTKQESGLKNRDRMCIDKLDRNHDHRLSIDELAGR
jgi:hypothetical protein